MKNIFKEWCENIEIEEETGEELAEIAFYAGYEKRQTEEENEGKYDFLREQEEERRKLEAENKRYREALTWYAENPVYLERISGYSNAMGVARTALQKEKGCE